MTWTQHASGKLNFTQLKLFSTAHTDSIGLRFEDLGVNWKKRLTDGRMKNVAFVLDPDNYWIEVIQNEKLNDRANW